jgi:hypothetical protein
MALGKIRFIMGQCGRKLVFRHQNAVSIFMVPETLIPTHQTARYHNLESDNINLRRRNNSSSSTSNNTGKCVLHYDVHKIPEAFFAVYKDCCDLFMVGISA